MTTLIILLSAIVGIVGIGVAVWSFLDTRKKYYEEYLDRKRKHGD